MSQRAYREFGRILLALIFILAGLSKFTDWSQTASFMAAKGMPAVPFFLFCSALIELFGGLSIIFGYQGKFFGTLLFVYLIPVTLVFHDFWAVSGAARQLQLMNFLKNLAIMGGLAHYALYEKASETTAGFPGRFERTRLRKISIT